MSCEMTVNELVEAVQGILISHCQESFCGVGTDSRKDLSGQLFVALKGDKFDAHEFLGSAAEAGAAVLLVHRISEQDEDKLKNQVTVVEVTDTLEALQKLGRYWRRKMPARILALSGTNGKTTTKEFAATILNEFKPTQYSKGSFNNHWGVPLSLLTISPQHEFAVIEMGMNNPGELRDLARIAEPDVVLITGVGRGHLEGLGSIEAVANAKEELYLSVRDDACRIFNLDNAFTETMYNKAKKLFPNEKILTYSEELPANVSLKVVNAKLESITLEGVIGETKGRALIPVFGLHNCRNIMAAACFALVAGMPEEEIWQALPKCHSTWGRSQIVNLKNGAKVIFDGYNANPDSMRAMLTNIEHLNIPGKRLAVLAEMLELGDQSKHLHSELGRQAAASGFSLLCFVGPHYKDFEAGVKAHGYSNKLIISNSYKESLASDIASVLEPSDILVVKGSRGMKLEQFVQALDPLQF